MNSTLHTSEKGIIKFLYWTPRIMGILAILFISVFALDAFAPGLSVWQQIGGFLMHMIPSFALAILLAYAWRHERWGGILFLLIGLIFTPIIFNLNYRMNNSVWISLSVIALITFPFVLVGILFLTHDFMNKKSHSHH